MHFGWTLGIAAAWEVDESDPTFSAATKDRLRADAWAKGPLAPSFDSVALARGLETLTQFPAAPYYPVSKVNCDDAELAANQCVLLDGTTTVSPSVVKAGVVADKPIPLAYRPPSNFFWRSNPFLVNSPPGSGETASVFPGSDLRLAYWMGRWVRRAP